MRKLVLILFLILTASVYADVWQDTVRASADDAGIYNTYTNDSNQIRMGKSGAGNSCDFAIRLLDVNIPKGSTIDTVIVYLRSFDDYLETQYDCNIDIYAEDTADAAAFGDSANFVARHLTTAHTSVSDVDTMHGFVWYNTRDKLGVNLCAIVQEVVDRGDWASGNDMVIIFRDNRADPSETSGQRAFRSWDYAEATSNAPWVYIVYSESGALTHSISSADTTSSSVIIIDDWSNTTGTVDTIWCWYGTTTIDDADSVMETSNITQTGDSLTVTGLSPSTEYNFWFGLDDDNGRDTASVHTLTTEAEVSGGTLVPIRH